MTTPDISNLPPGVPAPVFDESTSTPTPTAVPPKPKGTIWERKIGSLWIDIDKNGEKYLSGQLEVKNKKARILLLKNNNKRKPTSPDWEMFLADMPGNTIDKADIL